MAAAARKSASTCIKGRYSSATVALKPRPLASKSAGRPINSEILVKFGVAAFTCFAKVFQRDSFSARFSDQEGDALVKACPSP
jgi:hypothetical protein